AAHLSWTGPTSPDLAALISCDCTALPVTVNGDSVPLDVGRSERIFPLAIRKALQVRDGGCAFPGCGRPVSWCDAHHIRHWQDGGETSLDNGVLLCRHHHTVIHLEGWEVFLGADRHPWFRAPADPKRPRKERKI